MARPDAFIVLVLFLKISFSTNVLCFQTTKKPKKKTKKTWPTKTSGTPIRDDAEKVAEAAESPEPTMVSSESIT